MINYDESSSLYEKGREAMDDNRPWEAVELFEKSIGLYPHFKACELAGECCLRIGEPVRRSSIFQRPPVWGTTLFGLAICLLKPSSPWATKSSQSKNSKKRSP